jgi:hypothetical protein
MEEGKENCWRMEVEEKLKRLHSLLFGAERALENQDFSSAYVLALRLVGFLESQPQSQIDQAFVLPIRRQALQILQSARRSLIPQTDR